MSFQVERNTRFSIAPSSVKKMCMGITVAKLVRGSIRWTGPVVARMRETSTDWLGATGAGTLRGDDGLIPKLFLLSWIAKFEMGCMALLWITKIDTSEQSPNRTHSEQYTPADEVFVPPTGGVAPAAGAAAASAPPPPSKESRPPLSKSRVPPVYAAQ
ncbi:hypothetical protein E2C01_006456 [Portunus trituberculatus]|uniref:Uncharacterized protein n=1 Tax=Portunus trituberculatus TaxID=210409 RepID=A0A5B7CV95_PORTR|nr:hypothetical protein [Portunus trituberculatus]